ncbi:uncharacterized protein LOC132189619 isoform X2 [Corylus avellana]|uniref:uncharacterized protein LOC132189619 isoform X2 n=1 Tax=Corylus avellana TaxID=13451 RepID=UPI00286B987D|nr:uncharacterized protein LOC132189619 isoform X2 [Corylus avellana]
MYMNGRVGDNGLRWKVGQIEGKYREGRFPLTFLKKTQNYTFILQLSNVTRMLRQIARAENEEDEKKCFLCFCFSSSGNGVAGGNLLKRCTSQGSSIELVLCIQVVLLALGSHE